GLQLYMPGFIDAVNVAERSCEQVSAANRIEAARHFQRVLGRRVELRGLLTDNIVLFAAHCAGLDFEHQLNSWKCEASGARPVEHLAVGFVISDWHGGCFGCCASRSVSASLACSKRDRHRR